MSAADGAIPRAFRGYWSMTAADGRSLPAPYPDYEIEISVQPAACAVYKGKGVSRLEMFRGAEATVEGGAAPRLALAFRADGGRSFVLKLRQGEKQAVVGHVTHIQGEKTLLDVEIRLVAKRAPAK